MESLPRSITPSSRDLDECQWRCVKSPAKEESDYEWRVASEGGWHKKHERHSWRILGHSIHVIRLTPRTPHSSLGRHLVTSSIQDPDSAYGADPSGSVSL